MRRRWFWEATETRFSSRELRANRVRLAQTFVPLVVRIVFNVLGIQTLSNRNHRASGDLFETRFQRRRPTSRRGLTRSLVSRRGRPLGPVLRYGRVAPEESYMDDGIIKTNFLFWGFRTSVCLPPARPSGGRPFPDGPVSFQYLLSGAALSVSESKTVRSVPQVSETTVCPGLSDFWSGAGLETFTGSFPRGSDVAAVWGAETLVPPDPYAPLDSEGGYWSSSPSRRRARGRSEPPSGLSAD